MYSRLCSLTSILVLGLLSPHPASAVVSITVPPDGSGDPPDIQRAIEMAPPSDSTVIFLPDGIFRGTRNHDLDYQGKRILIRSVSGDPERCVIDCERSGRGILLRANEAGLVLQGLTIRGGLTADEGGAILVTRDRTVEIERCVFESNEAVSGGAVHARRIEARECLFRGNRADRGPGGGLYAVDARMTGCRFEDNVAEVPDGMGSGGGACTSSGDFAGCTFQRNAIRGWFGTVGGGLATGGNVHSCTFEENSATGTESYPAVGGGVAGATLVEHCTFVRNQAQGGGGASGVENLYDSDFIENTAVGDGLYPYSSGGGATGGLTVNCRFIGNSADTGGGGAEGTYYGCLFVRNHANYTGGGIASAERDEELVIARSCTFHDNDSPGTSAAYCALGYGQDGYIYDSIFTSNRGGPPLCCPGGHHGLWVSCSCLYGNEGGDSFQGNLIADPLYCLSDSLDFTLHADTPCSTAHCGLMGAYPIGCRGQEEISSLPATRAEPAGLRVWPNPLASACTIQLPSNGGRQVDLFDATGSWIRRLRAEGATRTLLWDGRDRAGRKVSAGVYLLRASEPGRARTERIVVLR
jgi:hypothetical protein